MNYSKRNFLAAILVVSQSLIFIPAQAQIVKESDTKVDHSVSGSAQVIFTSNTTLPTKSTNSEPDGNNTKVIATDINKSSSSAVTKPSTRIPISSRIFDHPGMKQ